MDNKLTKMEDVLSRLDKIVVAQDQMIAEIKSHIRPYKNVLRYYTEDDIGKIIHHIVPYKPHNHDIGVL